MDEPIDGYNTMISSNYIKFVEQAGARAVPIMSTKLSDDQIIELLSHLNGVLYTRGNVELTNEDGSLTEYSRKGKVILDTVKAYNDRGVYYPVWAV